MASLLFTTTDGLLSRAIRAATKSPCSHVAIGTEMQGVRMVLEADLFGVVARPRWRLLKESTLVAEVPMPALEVGIPFALEQLGAGYDAIGLLGYLPVLVGRWMRKTWRNPLASTRAVVCSELVVMVGQAAFLPAFKDLDPEATTPADLFERFVPPPRPPSLLHKPQSA